MCFMTEFTRLQLKCSFIPVLEINIFRRQRFYRLPGYYICNEINHL